MKRRRRDKAPHREKYLAEVFIVSEAITKPTIPSAQGMVMW